MDKIIQQLLIKKDASLRNAIQKMDEIGKKLLIVTDKNNLFYSLLSIGDIQRALLHNISLEKKIKDVLRKNVKVAYETDDMEKTKQEMKVRRNEYMPVLTEQGKISRIIFWNELFEEKEIINKLPDNTTVVIMAGGKGTRMKPITNVLPKPLIPLNDKTIIENIMNRFGEYGVRNFHISLNYKADFVQDYLEKHTEVPYNMVFLRELKPLGTAGALHLLKDKMKTTFFVTNCDILIDQDYTEVFHYHKKSKNVLTIFAAIKHYNIPYGTIDIDNNGKILKIKEKPELSFFINSGVYILEKEILHLIPDNTFFNITQLINVLISNNQKVGIFPVSEKSWVDLGNWSAYNFYQKNQWIK